MLALLPDRERERLSCLGSATVILIAVFMSAHVAPGADKDAEGLAIRESHATGVARFVKPVRDRAIQLPAVPGQRQPTPLDFFRAHGELFGVTDPKRQLVRTTSTSDALNHTHTSFQQIHDGVPVFGALLRVHADAQGNIAVVNGTFVPDIKVSTKPALTAEVASRIALDRVIDQQPGATDLSVLGSTLYVFRVNLARDILGPNHLVYEVNVGNGRNVREFVYVDAHKGDIVDQITGIHEALSRRIYDGGFGGAFLVWSEGDSLPFGDIDIDYLIDYTEDTYNLVSSATNGSFRSWDGADAIMHAVNDTQEVTCPNAFWNGFSTNFCLGVTGDDTVAHEWAHGYTDRTHNLIYQWQSGALNESYSDIYGEVVDLLNGSGTDSPISLRISGQCSIYGGSPPPQFEVNTPPAIAGGYPVGGAAFNPAPPLSVTADVELAVDGDDEGGAASVTDGCQPLIGFTAGHIALIDRGTCPFVTKVGNAASAGAVGVVIVNNQGDTVIQMGGSGPLTVPAVMIGQSDGGLLESRLPGVNTTITLSVSTEDSYRWLQGEDDPGFGGAIRDMWNPNCMGDPGRVLDVGQYFCGDTDNGGVHTNSGVPNHAFALLVDGGTYNGYTVNAIGLTKAFHIYWRAQSVYQVPASGFADHADALEQSCQDLIGVSLAALSTETDISAPSGEVISVADCAEISQAVAAVELRAEPVQCAFAPLLDPNAPPLCDEDATVQTIFHQDWESGLGSWNVGTRALANAATFDTPDWSVVGSLPDDRSGTAAFVANLVIGDCGSDTEAGVLYLESPLLNLPPWAVGPRVAFDHWVATEAGWDGGNVKISVNGAPWSLIPSSNFEFNAYNRSLNTVGDGNDNPLAGEEAFTGTDGGTFGGSWARSDINLSGIASAGDDIRLRFEMGLDGCNGRFGWYVDDVLLYSCEAAPIPTVSEWGLIAMTFLVLAAGALVIAKRRRVAAI